MNVTTLQTQGEQAVATRTNIIEPSARDGAARWPLSIILLPPPPAENVLAALTQEAVGLAGTDHLHSGATDCAHVTVRALENRRPVPQQDPFATRCASALDRACARHAPLSMKLERVLVAPGGVLALLHPTSPDADEFRTHTLGQELGPDAYREGILSPRDLWYVSLLHFRGPVEHPENLVTWSHQQLAPTVWTFPVATLCTYETTTTAMRPHIHHTATFGRTIRPHYFDATSGVGDRQ